MKEKKICMVNFGGLYNNLYARDECCTDEPAKITNEYFLAVLTRQYIRMEIMHFKFIKQ